MKMTRTMNQFESNLEGMGIRLAQSHPIVGFLAVMFLVPFFIMACLALGLAVIAPIALLFM